MEGSEHHIACLRNIAVCFETAWIMGTNKGTSRKVLDRRIQVPLKSVPELIVKKTAETTRKGGILGYARVSTADQDVAAQEDRLRQAGAIRVFVDVISGKQFERPGLSELIGHARAGDSLCVTRLDRLGRSLKELLETVENLKAHDIHLVSLEERIDTTSAAGELVFHVFGAIAHFERRLISERTRDGIAAARKRGSRPGRPALDGETVSAAQTLVEAGLTAGQAAKQLGIGRATAYRVTKGTR